MAGSGFVVTRPDFSTRGRRPEVRAADAVLLGAAALALALALASAAGAWGDLRRASADLRRTREETEAAAARARAAGDRKGGDALLSARAFLTAEAPPPRVLAELEALLPGDVRLLTLDLDYSERLELGMQLAAREPASYDRFLQGLQQSPLFTDVRPGEELRERGVRAQVRAAWARR